MDVAVSVKDVSVMLGGSVQALKGVSLELPAGRKIGVIGPSGAGKTTLSRCLVGRLGLDSGSIKIFGQPAGASVLRRQMTYMTQELSVYPDLTIAENLHYFAVMTGLPRAAAAEAVADVLKTVELTDKADVLVSKLSGGQKQRVSLGVALIGDPQVLVLDEPTVGLDPVLRDKLWALFGRLAGQGKTLIITSHSMDEAERCDDLVLIRDGAVVAHGSPAALKTRTKTHTIEQVFLKLVGEADV